VKRDTQSAELRLEIQSAAARAPRYKRAMVIAAIAIAGIVAASGVWRWSVPARPEARMLLQRSVTANPPENPVYAAAISPDGRYLGYADLTGVFVRLIATGETHALPLPEGFCFR